MPSDDYSAFRSEAETIIRISEPMRIGKHEWRLTLYQPRDPAYGVVVGYEWRRLDRRGFVRRTRAGSYTVPGDLWMRHTDWPHYDTDNGQTGGLPKTLIKLWERCPWAHRENRSKAA